ncbi:MAG: sulfatase-like hydrolase/transferase [Clostridia bacterium]|nr:sulfatase-like hydrolase/transferase [Clostridia bacterium]
MESIDIKLKPTTPTRKRRISSLWHLPIFFALSFIWMETVFRVTIYKSFFGAGLIYSTLFSVVTALVFALLSTLSKNRKVNFAVATGLIAAIYLLFGIQMVYFTVFQVPMAAFSFTTPGQVVEFMDIILLTIWQRLFVLILMVIPLVLFCIFGRRRINLKRTPLPAKALLAAAALAAYLFTLLCLLFSGNGPASSKTVYFNANVPSVAQEKLGVVTNMRLDFQRLIFGFEERTVDPDISDEPGSDDPLPTVEPTPEPSEIVYGDNVMDIDFAALAAAETNSTLKGMHEYFGSLTPTKKNEKTGIFEGCNLIFITAESFSRYPQMFPELFPTLTKMATEGFEFTNFYNSSWPVSTTDGEYVACTGLIPKSGVRSFKLSANNYMPFCMGNQFKKLGYPDPLAYHNHTYTYYQRDQSHPNIGYIYKGYGNGLDVRKTWPESDLEMMQLTLPEYINNDRFHTYYMTVSGHQLYTFTGNYQSKKHKEEVAHLDLSDGCRAYLACNLELENSMKYLIDELEKAGKLENTVFVISADHYPYGLSVEDHSAFVGHEIDQTFELFKSTLIIWKPGMEHEVIDDPISSLDIIPTISNLFGLEYDSRLLMGRDVFSDSEPLAIFQTRSWITDKCSYNAKTGEVTSFTGEEISQEYLSRIKKTVANKFKYSPLILDNDYYAKVLK